MFSGQAYNREVQIKKKKKSHNLNNFPIEIQPKYQQVVAVKTEGFQTCLGKWYLHIILQGSDFRSPNFIKIGWKNSIFEKWDLNNLLDLDLK